MKRSLEQYFLEDLKDGILKPCLQYVNGCDNLIMEIRGNYVNIYYRGGNVYQIKPVNSGSRAYRFSWDSEYNRSKIFKLDLGPLEIDVSSHRECQDCVDLIPKLIEVMESHKGSSQIEKSIQQDMVLSRLFSEYLFTDFEYQKGNDARFDLMGIKLCTEKPMLSFIELKQGYSSLRTKSNGDEKSSSGLRKHLKDIVDEIQSPQYTSIDPKAMIYTEVLQARALYKQKVELGLLPPKMFPDYVHEDGVEVLFVLADFVTGASTRVSTYLIDEIKDIAEYLNSKELKFKLNIKFMFLKTEEGDGFKISDKSDLASLENWKAVLSAFYPDRNFYYQYQGGPRVPLLVS